MSVMTAFATVKLNIQNIFCSNKMYTTSMCNNKMLL